MTEADLTYSDIVGLQAIMGMLGTEQVNEDAINMTDFQNALTTGPGGVYKLEQHNGHDVELSVRGTGYGILTKIWLHFVTS